MHTFTNSFLRKVGAAEIAVILIIAATFAVPVLTENPLAYSLTNQILIATTAAFSVYIMLRMNLMTFAVPTFMAIGGYTSAICGLNFAMTDVLTIGILCFLIPALLALPIGALVLRLRGVYFVLVTFVLTEITQLLLFETPDLTGGSNGMIGMPALTFFGTSLADNRAVVQVTIGLALTAALITAIVTRVFRQQFAGIEENEMLAQSLGLVVWHHKAFGFVVAAGISGLAGFALVNMLLTAHPTSFAPLSSVNYIAYAFIGGQASMLGPLVGAALLVWAAEIFSIRGEYSQMLFGFLIILVVLGARSGIVGTVAKLGSVVTGRAATVRTSAAATVSEERP